MKKESKLQEQCCEYITKIGGRNIKLDSQTGLPDYVHLLPTGISAYVEYKRPDGKGVAAPSQILWSVWLKKNNHVNFFCESLGNFKEKINTIIKLCENGD